jgi:fructose-1,6-bisphosphatase/sedoheptulose 1,7-bisphosphatase-like protein
LTGVRYRRGSAFTQSIVISTYTRSVRTIDARHQLRPRDLRLSPIQPSRTAT